MYCENLRRYFDLSESEYYSLFFELSKKGDQEMKNVLEYNVL